MSPTTFPVEEHKTLDTSPFKRSSNLGALPLQQEEGCVVEKKGEPTSTSTRFRDKENRRSLPAIRKGNVSLEVPVPDDVHETLAALAKLEGTNAQRYNSRILQEHANNQPRERVELAKKLLAESRPKTPHLAKIKTLEDRVKTLEQQLSQSGGRSSRG